MIPFLDLKGLNAQYKAEACTRVVGMFKERVCGTKYAIGLDALILILRAYKEMGIMNDGDEVPSNTYIASILAISSSSFSRTRYKYIFD